MNHIYIVNSLIFLIFFIAILLGVSNFSLDLKKLHTLIGFTFIILTIFGMRTHWKILLANPLAFIGWLHVIIFTFLIYLGIKALKHWFIVDFINKYYKQEANHENDDSDHEH